MATGCNSTVPRFWLLIPFRVAESLCALAALSLTGCTRLAEGRDWCLCPGCIKKFAREGSVGTSIEATIEFGNISRATIDGAAVSDSEVLCREESSFITLFPRCWMYSRRISRAFASTIGEPTV